MEFDDADGGGEEGLEGEEEEGEVEGWGGWMRGCEKRVGRCMVIIFLGWVGLLKATLGKLYRYIIPAYMNSTKSSPKNNEQEESKASSKSTHLPASIIP